MFFNFKVVGKIKKLDERKRRLNNKKRKKRFYMYDFINMIHLTEYDTEII